MKTLTKRKLDELAAVMPIINENEQRQMIGGGYVRVTTTRTSTNENSTLSSFVAVAYDDDNKEIKILRGYFLEPGTDYDRCTVSGSDTAINSGTYNIAPSTYKGQAGYYEVMGVEGRSAIKIHAGNNGSETEGCLMPGATGTTNSETGESTVGESTDKLEELTKFFRDYGGEDIKMTILDNKDQN